MRSDGVADRGALITGGAGFIGSHLADRLLATGWRVVAVDDLSVGRAQNVRHLLGDDRFTLVVADVGNVVALERALAPFHVDAVFHLAAIHYIPYCNDHPSEAIRINVLGTQSVIDLAARRGVQKIVFTSTSDVYVVKTEPHVETDPLEPYTVYGTSKLFAERLLALAARRHPGLSVSVARLFNVYGPRETNPHVLPEILAQLRTGESRLRLGNTWPKRDFVYVDDVAAALAALATVDVSLHTVNVGSGRAHSIENVVAALERPLGRKLTIEIDPARVRPVERACLAADIGKALASLPWSPACDLDEGLRRWLAAEPVTGMNGRGAR
ncbi:MAG: SDR family NAD(P)-dependent oxidoreductase [Chloroflexi bacterium]|nr:SDR family NAD(P)-dependent oxidoreductase [Chloroflexota bacterium]